MLTNKGLIADFILCEKPLTASDIAERGLPAQEVEEVIDTVHRNVQRGHGVHLG